MTLRHLFSANTNIGVGSRGARGRGSRPPRFLVQLKVWKAEMKAKVLDFVWVINIIVTP